MRNYTKDMFCLCGFHQYFTIFEIKTDIFKYSFINSFKIKITNSVRVTISNIFVKDNYFQKQEGRVGLLYIFASLFK